MHDDTAGCTRLHIHGYTNWRLEGLQEALRAGTVPSFHALMSTTRNQFYNHDRGTNYSQARYLCYYLQEKGLLTQYYREFRAARHQDPTGYYTFEKVVAPQDMKSFRSNWEAFTLKLSYDAFG